MIAAPDTVAQVREVTEEKYKYGFVTDIEMETAPKGLNEDIIRFISAKKDVKLREIDSNDRHRAADREQAAKDRDADRAHQLAMMKMGLTLLNQFNAAKGDKGDA